MRIARRADVDRAAYAAPVVGAAFPVLLGFERGQHVLEGPARGAMAFPGVVISLCAARPHHRVDGASATEDTPERHVELAVVQLRNRRDRQRPVERTADIVEPDAGIADRRAGILASRLHDQNVGARLGEFASNDRAGRTASNDDIVIRSLGLRLIERLGFAGGQRLLHRCGRKPAGKTSRAHAH